jgi:branched-chain amino acid transport system ATP-binding protein
VSAVLQLDRLTAGYDRAAVVRNVSLAVSRGEIVALLGPNGAGKTTTLKTISGLVRSMGGVITFAGEDLSAVAPNERARKGIAHVPEGRGLFSGLSVAEHFRLGHRGERLDEDVAYEYFPNLRKLASRPAGVLSGGEQQMLAVGRALARNPRLLLLDELSMGLAPVIVEQLMPVIRSYADQSGCGVLLVEQHVHLALGIADRAYIMVQGEIRIDGDAADLRADRTLIAASYLGQHAGDVAADGPRAEPETSP